MRRSSERKPAPHQQLLPHASAATPPRATPPPPAELPPPAEPSAAPGLSTPAAKALEAEAARLSTSSTHVHVEAPSTAWSLAVRIVRAQHVLTSASALAGEPSNGARLYVYYSLFGGSGKGGGGVTASVHGETRHVLLDILVSSQPPLRTYRVYRLSDVSPIEEPVFQ